MVNIADQVIVTHLSPLPPPGLLHRDGSVLTSLPLAELEALSEMGTFGADTLYRALGCKLIAGPEGESLPLKDVATSDALLLRVPPAEDDTASRATLATLAKAGVHAIVPAEALKARPLPGAVALVELAELEAKLMLRTGEGGAASALGDSGRLAVTVRGDESDEQVPPPPPLCVPTLLDPVLTMSSPALHVCVPTLCIPTLSPVRTNPMRVLPVSPIARSSRHCARARRRSTCCCSKCPIGSRVCTPRAVSSRCSTSGGSSCRSCII